MKNVSLIRKTMSSREIAEVAGRNHKDVMRSIRDMEEAWVKINGRNFALVDYVDEKGERRPMYQLNKTECLYVATKFNDEARAKLVIRWEELERTSVDFSDPDLVVLKAINILQEKLKLKEAQFVEQNRQIREAAPKIRFANMVSGTENAILIRDFAKLMCDNGFNIGQNRLFEWLRTHGYLMKNNAPYQKYIDMGLFETIERVIGSGEYSFTSITTKITGKGQVYFPEKIAKSISQISA